MSKSLSKYKQYNQPGLNGFLGWLKKALGIAAQVLMYFSPAIGSALDDFSNGDGMFMGMTTGNYWGRGVSVTDQIDLDIEVTPQDEMVLDTWLANNFNPYYNAKLNQVRDLSISAISVSDFIIIYNAINIYIAYIAAQSQLDKSNGVDGLSENGVLARSYFLQVQSQALRSYLDEYVEQNNIDIFSRKTTINLDTTQFLDLGLNSPKNISVNYQEVASLNGNDVAYDDVTDPTDVSITDPSDTFIETPGNTDSLPATNQSKSNGIVKGLLWTIFGLTVSKLIKK